MYTSAEKSRLKPSRAIANAVGQPKQSNQQHSRVVDNRATSGFSDHRSVGSLHQQKKSHIGGNGDPLAEATQNTNNQQAGPDHIKAIGKPPAAKHVLQRSVGLEIESTHDWQVYDENFKAITGEHRKLYVDPEFWLETELSGKLEFIIEPPLDTTGELLTVMNKVVKVATAIDDAKVTTKQNVRDDFASEHMKKEVRKDVNLFKLSDAVKGGASLYVSKGLGEFQGGFQATVGVHLSAIPELMTRLASGALGAYPAFEKIDRAVAMGEIARQKSTGKPFAPYTGISPEMEGLLNLIYYYLLVGESTDQRPFPKGLTQVMARTNFGKMLSMTPEARRFALYPELWVNLVTQSAGINPGRKVFCGKFGDPGKETTTVDVTVGDWLRKMTEGVDVLSVQGGGPPVLKTMGGMTKTDDLGAEGEENRGVIVELRGLDFSTVGINEWRDKARTISELIENVNSRNRKQFKYERNEFVETGTSMYWSPWKSEQEGGLNILEMGIDAMNAPFKSQVRGLVTRARERKDQVRLEIESGFF